jgi:hypothetical protein
MTLKKIFGVLLVICSTSLISLGFLSNVFTKPKPQPMFNLEKGNNYQKDWKRVDSLINKGLTQSALDLVIKIYEKAKTENNIYALAN